MSQTAAQQQAAIAANNANFMANSVPMKIACTYPNGQNYVAGATLPIEVPLLAGWAQFIRVFYNLSINVTLNGGTAVANAAAPQNIFSQHDLTFLNTTHRTSAMYWSKVNKQTQRDFLDKDNFRSGVNALVATGTPLAAGVNTWIGYMDIPLQIVATDISGLVPLGIQTNPLKVLLRCNNQFVGNDPWDNVVSVTGGATVAVTGTVSAYAQYRFGQSPHDPKIQVPTPTVGTFARYVETSTAITSTGSPTIVKIDQPYVYLQILQAVVVPNSPTVFCDESKITAYTVDFDASHVMDDYSQSGAGFAGKLIDQRELYHVDLDPGVIVADFLSGSMPEIPNGINTLNVNAYGAAQTKITYNGPLAANGTGNGNRIVTCGIVLENIGV